MTHIRWHHTAQDPWAYEELDTTRHSVRHIEAGTHPAAASLAELIAARDSGDPWAVNAYERRYGVLPEGEFPPDPGRGLRAPLADDPVGPGRFIWTCTAAAFRILQQWLPWRAAIV